jgi:predicted nucleic acid-binding protein
MLVVSNTSPLSNLAIIGQLELVREQLGSVIIPPAVRAELSRNPSPAALVALEAAIRDGWISVKTLSGNLPAELAASLHLGEAEALALAIETKAALVLLDESAARDQARQLGFKFTGALGVLRWAKQNGRISSLKEPMFRLRKEARFFINPALEKALLVSVGEM